MYAPMYAHMYARCRYKLDLSTPYGKMVCAELVFLSETRQVGAAQIAIRTSEFIDTLHTNVVHRLLLHSKL